MRPYARLLADDEVDASQQRLMTAPSVSAAAMETVATG